MSSAKEETLNKKRQLLDNLSPEKKSKIFKWFKNKEKSFQEEIDKRERISNYRRYLSYHSLVFRHLKKEMKHVPGIGVSSCVDIFRFCMNKDTLKDSNSLLYLERLGKYDYEFEYNSAIGQWPFDTFCIFIDFLIEGSTFEAIESIRASSSEIYSELNRLEALLNQPHKDTTVDSYLKDHLWGILKYVTELHKRSMNK